ncbi:OmpH family outer membrane protein [Anaeromyxobacter terrae]|uniref:OmpH family outer membrane protein n=1 Tax=Anaeromyxobacter terrae TaxID=2925406 RepID=UPI001F593B1E|nr:OmpH family outer membrane protein [Anaeromyxobacter sp. SG22]
MRHALRLTAVLALLAATAAHAAEPKIGFVDLQRALNEIDEGKAAKATLKHDFDEKQKQLDAKKVEFDKLRQDFEKQAVVMAEQARRDKAAELDRKANDLQQFWGQLQKDLSEREREVTRGIFDKMANITREIAEADGFTMVLERSDSGIVFALPALDLTNELIRKYNARFPGGAAKKPAEAKPAAQKPAAPAGKK